MKAEFIPYELALKLKELGFDEPCFGRYDVPGYFILSGCYSNSPLISILVEQNDICEAHTLAPTFSQAFRWFRQKGIMFYITSNKSDIGIFYKVIFPNGEAINISCDTYEDAELELLKILIKIIRL